SPAVFVRSFGQEKGQTDDHLHIDLGYVSVTPRECSEANSAPTGRMKDFGIGRIGRVYRERAIAATPPRAVIGLEAEFHLFVNGRKRRPEKVFGDPSRLVRQRMIPRTGKSFQLPAGGAIYFDTGVIEVATPIIELERGCCQRATRLLWEQIRYLRAELDHWAKRHG